MSLKRPDRETKITDFFNKRFKCETDKRSKMASEEVKPTIDSQGNSVQAQCCVTECTEDDFRCITDEPKYPMEPCTYLQLDNEGSSTIKVTADDRDKEKCSPTLECTDNFSGEPLNDTQPVPVTGMNSEESSCEAMCVKKGLSKGIAKDQLRRLKTGDLDIGSFPNHVDLSELCSSPEQPDFTHDVRMPFHGYGLQGVRTRWDAIKSSLSDCGEIKTSKDLENLICSYNHNFTWKCPGFDNYFATLTREEQSATLKTLDKMAKLALEIEHLVVKPIPILQKQKDQAITLSQHLIACLLANAFFCTFPRTNETLPSINFSGLFQSGKVVRYGKVKDRSDAMVHKLRCIFHYFSRVTSCMPTGKVTFHRQVLKESDMPKWKESKTRLTELHVSSTGSIEDEDGLFQVDFANKKVGGGALGTGCVQEEIRFMVSTELIVSRLFTEILDVNECLIVTGCETFSTYSGYGDSFVWTGDYIDKVPRDEFGRKMTQVVMMDAFRQGKRSLQFNEELVNRELRKAYCGFFCPTRKEDVQLSAVSTGNWGCGAFGGDRHLKSLLQLMAAAEAGRDVCYFTFDDDELVNSMFEVHSTLRKHEKTVGQIYSMIEIYNNNMVRQLQKKQTKSIQPLFDYLLSHLRSGFVTSSPEQTDDDGEDTP